jgi:hypothetical protein
LKFEFVVDEDEFSGDNEFASTLSSKDLEFLNDFDEKLPLKKK